MNCFHFRKILPLLIALVLFAAVGCAAAEAPAEEYYRVVWSPGPSYACGRTEVPLLVLSDDPARQTLAEDEIRFFPFDAETGLYAGGEGEPAGDRAKILNDPGIPVRYYVTLSEPGKYLIAGYECYILDPQVPALKALYEELESLMESSEKPKEAQTAKALHDWLCGRVKAVIPEEEAARLSAACADPANALLTGYALREAYAPLYRMLLNAAGIRCLNVSGTAGGEAAAWNLCRLNGKWVWTDAAMDDVKDKKGSKYMALNDSKIEKDHTLSDGDRAFVEKLLRPATYDALLDGTLPISWLKCYEKKDLNFAFLRNDDPPITVGDSMTMTFHLLTNETEKYRNMTPEQFLTENLAYYPWLDEQHAYYLDVGSEKYTAPPVTDLVTVESAAEDLSAFTLTFHAPGRYEFFSEIAWCVSVYLISPDQAEPAALAAEIEAVVADAKKAPSETAAADKLMKWIRKKVKYNYPVFNGSVDATDRDNMAAREGFSALLYGKAVCDGYADAYDLLLRSAGITDFVDGCVILATDVGHAENINRLDGVWSFSDATWNRFNWPREKMEKDREAYFGTMISGLFFSDPFDLMADQAAEDCLEGACLPRALKYLPRNGREIDGYEESLKHLIDVAVQPAEEGLSLALTAPGKLWLKHLEDGKVVSKNQDRSGKAVTSFTSAKFTADEPFQLDIGYQSTISGAESFPILAWQQKPVVYEQFDFENGEPVRAEYYCVNRIKMQDPMFPKCACQQTWAYSADKTPVSVHWYLQSEDGDVRLMSLKIFFDGEGNAERYAVKWRIHLKDIQVSWEATADGVLTSYNGQPVENPDDIHLSRVDLITFR